MFTKPILFIIFNRPETTLAVLGQIKKIQPERLFIAADGARVNRPGEAEAVAALREKVLAQIDWPCELRTLFRAQNLGCKQAVSSAITWFFEQVEEGIILEDDCWPDLSFFDFCSWALDKYKSDEQVMHVSGNFFQPQPIGKANYYFSHIPHIWGWATWRRAWQKYDLTMSDYSAWKTKGGASQIFGGLLPRWQWEFFFDKVHSNQLNTWDYQWTYAVFKNKGLCVTPNVNLIKNLGFGGEATHTAGESRFADMTAGAWTANDAEVVKAANKEADDFVLKNNFGVSPIIYITKHFLVKFGLMNLLKKLR